MTSEDVAPMCPRCREDGSVRATLRVSLGTYYCCDICNYIWCVEPARADPESRLTEDQLRMLRRLRRVLGVDPQRPKLH